MTAACPRGEQRTARPLPPGAGAGSVPRPGAGRPRGGRPARRRAHNGRVSPLLRRDKNPSPKPADRTVTLVGKPGCHLCDDAREVIVRVTGELGAGFEELDILQDEELYRTYAEQIPVTLIDGRQHDFWRVDERRLRAALGA